MKCFNYFDQGCRCLNLDDKEKLDKVVKKLILIAEYMSFSETTDRRVKPKTLIRLQPPDKDKLEQARQIRYGFWLPVSSNLILLCIFVIVWELC